MTRQEMIDLLGWRYQDMTTAQQDTLSRAEYIVELAVRRERAATAEGWRVEREALLEALKNIERSTYDTMTATLARVAISKTEENT